jgi:hypothetical protein
MRSMVRAGGVAILVLLSTAAAAQQPRSLLPSPGAAPIEATPLEAPPAAVPQPGSPAPAAPPPVVAQPALPEAAAPAPAQPAPAPSGRVFCDQSVGYRVADADSVAEPFRPFIGIFSDAAWNPQLCAALIVETVQNDGTASIAYVFGPMGSGGKASGGVLRGTGIVKDGALLFQNSDGSQFVFKPFYTDLTGSWTTPKGQTYQAVFKRSY